MGTFPALPKALLRFLVLGLSALALTSGLVGIAFGQTRHAVYIEIDDAINSITAGYLDRAMDRAENGDAELLIVQLDTPGGLLSSTRDMVTKLLGADLPSVVYVAPGGAHAASAGTFIAAAANIAVMAPGTNIGAASPVGMGGEDLPETIKNKATEDAAALLRDIAARRGRNVERLEATVLSATAYSSQEAVDLKVVDFVAIDLDDLLRQLDGMPVETAAGSRVLSTVGLEVRRLNMSFMERFLLVLSDPNISFILLSIGGLGIVVELLSPGVIVPGVVGAICLLLAFIALGNLPVNWAGAAFILLALVLIFLEAQVAGFGILGLGAVVSFVFGTLLLFNRFSAPSPTAPEMGVSLWVLIPMAVLMLGGGGWFITTMVKSRQTFATTTASTVVGAVGVVSRDLDPRGTVQLSSELWSAVSDDGNVIESGERVRVVSIEGLTVRVSKLSE